MKLKKIPIDPIPPGRCQRETSESDLICSKKRYLVYIYGEPYAGRFSKQWYGWSFDNWGSSGIQLDSIDGDIYEILKK